MGIHLTSAAFAEGQPIPTQYTCDGADQSPPLSWSNLPTSTVSLALICDDPDAPGKTWVHWVLINIPPDKKGLPAAVPTTGTLPDGEIQGTNDFRRLGYGGPCPPHGKTHRYFFTLCALDCRLELKPGCHKEDVVKVMNGHILAQGQLMGVYTRKK